MGTERQSLEQLVGDSIEYSMSFNLLRVFLLKLALGSELPSSSFQM